MAGLIPQQIGLNSSLSYAGPVGTTVAPAAPAAPAAPIAANGFSSSGIANGATPSINGATNTVSNNDPLPFGMNGNVVQGGNATQTGPLYTNNDPANTNNTLQTNAQVANAFVNPQSASIYSNIQGAADLQNSPNYANSPLAGLVGLGNTTNAGYSNIGPTAMSGYTALGAAPTVGQTNINTAQTNALSGAQMNTINMLNAQAQGQGPNLAAEQAQASGQQNVANEMAMVASQRGSGNTALGLRSAQNAIAANNQQTAQNAYAATLQNQLNAEGQLTGAEGTANSQAAQVAQAQGALSNQNVLANQSTLAANQLAQGQLSQTNSLANQSAINTANSAQASLNQNINLTNAAAANQAMLQQGSMNQQTNLANQSTDAATQAMNANEYNAALQAQMTQSNNDMTSAANYENMVTNQVTQLQGIANKTAINSANNQLGLEGAGIAGGAGTIAALGAAASDRKLKTSIKSGKRDMKNFLSQIGSLKSSQFNLLERV